MITEKATNEDADRPTDRPTVERTEWLECVRERLFALFTFDFRLSSCASSGKREEKRAAAYATAARV